MFCKSFWCRPTQKCSGFNTLAMLCDGVSMLSRLCSKLACYVHKMIKLGDMY